MLEKLRLHPEDIRALSTRLLTVLLVHDPLDPLHHRRDWQCKCRARLNLPWLDEQIVVTFPCAFWLRPLFVSCVGTLSQTENELAQLPNWQKKRHLAYSIPKDEPRRKQVPRRPEDDAPPSTTSNVTLSMPTDEATTAFLFSFSTRAYDNKPCFLNRSYEEGRALDQLLFQLGMR